MLQDLTKCSYIGMERIGLIMHKHLIILAAALLLPVSVYAQPAKIIIARHAEKADNYTLCAMGTERAQALAAEYLGRNARKSIFGAGGEPAAMMAITVHTIETITPAAQSWNMSLTAYRVFPVSGGKDRAEEEAENRRTQEAAHDVLTDERYSGKTVVMIWEHKRIANVKLQAEYPGQMVSLRQLLHLDRVAGVPKNWPDETYDYFWIVNFAPGNPVPVSFRMLRQVFDNAFNNLPANRWGEAEPFHIKAGCLK
jgi:hypothetical protein